MLTTIARRCTSRRVWRAFPPLMLLSSHVLAADEESGPGAPNSLYFELGGNGGLYSVNYDRRLDDHWVMRVGISWMDLCVFSCAQVTTVPLAVSYLIGPGSHLFEVGMGVTPFIRSRGGEGPELLAYGVPMAGYRYQPRHGGFSFRAMATPLVRPGEREPVLPWFGLSFGASF